MPETVAQASVDLTLNTTPFDRKIASTTAKMQSSFTTRINKISSQFSRLNGAVKLVGRQIDRAFRLISGTAIGTGLLAVRKYLKTSSEGAIEFNTKLRMLNGAMQRLGEKVLKLKLFGKDASEWVDTLTRKLNSVTQEQLQKVFDTLKKIAAVWLAFKTVSIGITINAAVTKAIALVTAVVTVKPILTVLKANQTAAIFFNVSNTFCNCC